MVSRGDSNLLTCLIDFNHRSKILLQIKRETKNFPTHSESTSTKQLIEQPLTGFIESHQQRFFKSTEKKCTEEDRVKRGKKNTIASDTIIFYFLEDNIQIKLIFKTLFPMVSEQCSGKQRMCLFTVELQLRKTCSTDL